MSTRKLSAQQSEVTIVDVANLAGVSTATVSRALSGSEKVTAKTRDKVFAAVHELGFIPDGSARALAGRRTRALGIVLPHIDGQYYADVLVGFELAAAARGMSVSMLLADPRKDSRAGILELASRVDALAFAAKSNAADDLIFEIGRSKPVVTVARTSVSGCDALFAENSRCAESLVGHLIGHGRKNIAFVGRNEEGSDIGQRYMGVECAVRSAGLEPLLVIDAAPVEADGRRAAAQLLHHRDRIDAIVCGNDELALAVSDELRHAGVSIPHDMAVTGWDDTTAARFVQPSLTTVRQPVQMLGSLAAQRLVERVEGAPHNAELVTLDSHPIFRSSCGCESSAGSVAPSER